MLAVEPRAATVEKSVAVADDVVETLEVEASPAAEGAPNAWPDESAEVAMMSELRTRGELATPAAAEAVEETDTKDLPSLDAVLQRIPPAVRETVDDLFRARFVRVVRVPKNALKG